MPGIGHQNEAEAELSRLRRELEIVRQERDILKGHCAVTHPLKAIALCKALLLQDARPRLTFAFIHKHKGEYELKIMCRMLGVSRGGCYMWVRRQEQPPSRRATGKARWADQELTAAIQTTFKRSRAHTVLHAFRQN